MIFTLLTTLFPKLLIIYDGTQHTGKSQKSGHNNRSETGNDRQTGGPNTRDGPVSPNGESTIEAPMSPTALRVVLKKYLNKLRMLPYTRRDVEAKEYMMLAKEFAGEIEEITVTKKITHAYYAITICFLLTTACLFSI